MNRKQASDAPEATLGRAAWLLALVLVACGPVALFWGFTVDDAWIVSRVADNGKSSGQFSFNVAGPGSWVAPSDAVTPLGYAQMLAFTSALIGKDSFSAARILGVFSWISTWVGLAWLGMSSYPRPPRRGAHALFVLAPLACIPGAAWAGAGLETPFVSGLLCLGLALYLAPGAMTPAKGWLGPGLVGSAAALRPELLPVVAATLFLGPERDLRSGLGERAGFVGAGFVRARLMQVAWAALPVLLVAAIRYARFGDVLPLSFHAKPSDPNFGLRYAFGGLVFSGAPWLLFSTLRWSGSSRPEIGEKSLLARTPWILLGAHLFALTLAGGDWMPLYRLMVPLSPWLAFRAVWGVHSRPGALVGALLALGASGLLTFVYRQDSADTLRTRLTWVEEAKPLLARAHRIAAVDIGWVGRATSAEIFDLSGVTDRQVARLPGGHTSHSVSPALLDARDVDTWIVRGAAPLIPNDLPSPAQIQATYAVDARLLPAAEGLGFVVRASMPIARTGTSYYFLSRVPRGH